MTVVLSSVTGTRCREYRRKRSEPLLFSLHEHRHRRSSNSSARRAGPLLGLKVPQRDRARRTPVTGPCFIARSMPAGSGNCQPALSGLVEKTPKRLRLAQQTWNMHRGGLPDNLWIDRKVVMRDQIAHSRRSRPVDGGRYRPGCIGNLLHGFTDNLQVMQNSIEQQVVIAERFQRSHAKKTFDLLGAFDQVIEIQQPVTRHGPSPSGHAVAREASALAP
jgi:hypothetical protein